jgi:hypothetical protein
LVPGAEKATVFESKRFGVPLGTAVTTPDRALEVRAFTSAAGVWCPYDICVATTPETTPAAIEVPEAKAAELLAPIQADRVSDPGAMMSTQLPEFEYGAQPSVAELAATVIAAGTLAGETLQALVPVFPAATTNTKP